MLVWLLFAAGWITATVQRTSAVPVPSRVEAMADTLPYGNRFGIPFTQEEVKRALLQVYTEQEADEQVRRLYDPDPDVIGVTIMDGTLLLLATLSPEMADRVEAYRPKIKPLVDRIRADPQAALRSWRRGP
jgi:hypothetical protein